MGSIAKAVSSFFGGGSQPAPQIIVAPAPAPVPATPVPAAPAATAAPVPMADTAATTAKKKAIMAKASQRGGRQSTILTSGDADTLG